MESNRSARCAYTIVELVIVVMIVGILAAAAVPRYSSALAAYRADAAAKRVAADLRMVRLHARRTSQAQTIQFDVAANSYAAAGVSDIDRPTTTYAVSLAASEYLADIVSASFGGSASLPFDVFGRPSSSGSVVVSCGGQQRTIQVDEGGNVYVF